MYGEVLVNYRPKDFVFFMSKKVLGKHLFGWWQFDIIIIIKDTYKFRKYFKKIGSEDILNISIIWR